MTDVSREMLAAYAHEDPLESGKQWGMIQNQNVKVYINQSTGLALYMRTIAEIHHSGEQEHDRRRHQRHRPKHLPTRQYPQNVLYRMILLNPNPPSQLTLSRNNRRREEAASHHRNLQQNQPH